MGDDRGRAGDRRGEAPLTRGHRLAGLGRTGAYVLIVVVAALGFRADRYQSYRLCERARQNTVVLRVLVNRVSTLQAPPGSPPQLVELLERARAESDAFRADANRILAVPKCHRPWP